MSREFDSTKLNYIASSLKELVSRLDELPCTGGISDLGYSIGMCVGYAYKDMTEEEIQDFITGFRDGNIRPKQ
jgi:hypothetical protein